MELRISDLLDGLEEVEVDIRPDTRASAQRIEKLTMEKIHSGKHRRGLSVLSKILIGAAAIAALTIPAAAAGRLHFTDWLDGTFVSGKTDRGQSLDTDGRDWQAFGYSIDLKAEAVSNHGLTLICEEWGNRAQGNGEKLGVMTAEEGFWLEKWEESGYVPMKPKKEPAAGNKAIDPLKTVSWQIDWTDSYGVLPAGSYRIGKTFTHTDPAGNAQSRDFYAKFRVYGEDMESCVERCKAALEELRSRDSYHLTETVRPNVEDYDFYTSTIWKAGDDFLEEVRYMAEDGTVVGRKGYLFREGKGYKLTWNGDSVLSGVATWEAAGWLSERTRDQWTVCYEIHDMSVGEAFCEGDTVQILAGYPGQDMAYQQIRYTMDGEGRLTSAQMNMLDGISEPLEDHVIDGESYLLEVHSTSAAQIAKIIAAQNVDRPVSFSWAEDQTKYPAGSAGVKTEGFANTAAQTISMDNVVDLARKECTLQWQNTAVVSYDEAAKVWKVELGFSQDDTVCENVYLSSEGITLLVVTK